MVRLILVARYFVIIISKDYTKIQKIQKYIINLNYKLPGTNYCTNYDTNTNTI